MIVLLTKYEKRLARRAKALESAAHVWVSRSTPTFMIFRCALCNWEVKLRKGARHNGYTPSRDEDLQNFLPILDNRGLSCYEKVVQKVMSI
jgi:hypothetical protein